MAIVRRYKTLLGTIHSDVRKFRLIILFNLTLFCRDNGFAFSEVEDIPWNIFVKFPTSRREGPSVWHYLGLYSFDLVGDTPNQSTISTLEWNTCFSESVG